MMKYYILSQSNNASREFWRLTRPNPDPADITLYLCATLTHPDGRQAIGVPEEPLYIDPVASDGGLPPLIGLTTQERNLVRNWIRDNRGQWVIPTQAIPPARLLTHAQMEADGWFPASGGI
jgi:hypothetical protein